MQRAHEPVEEPGPLLGHALGQPGRDVRHEPRLQARKVRSFARENRASGSEPTRNTDPGNRCSVLIP